MLYLVATPIGNLGDMSLRAIEVLREVDLVASEDTRKTGVLLQHFGINKPQLAFHEHNEQQAGPRIVGLLKQGQSVALVTDAGTPHVSDPGAELVAAAAAAGHKVFAVPGASALTAALSISGIAAKRTLFAGFLPPAEGARRAELAGLKSVDAALVFFEAPHRIEETLADMAHVLGERQAVLCRELTKRHEEARRGTLADLASAAAAEPDLRRGEIVLVVAPPAAADPLAGAQDLDAALRRALATMRVKDAADAVAGALGLPRRAVYARALELKADA